MTEGQKGRLLNALMQRPMTSLDCVQQLGILRAAAVVFELKKLGWIIETKRVKVKNRFGEDCHLARYHLKNPIDWGDGTVMDIPEDAWGDGEILPNPPMPPAPEPGEGQRAVMVPCDRCDGGGMLKDKNGAVLGKCLACDGGGQVQITVLDTDQTQQEVAQVAGGGGTCRAAELIKQRITLGKFDIHNEQHMAQAKAAGVDPFVEMGIHPGQQALL